MTYDKKASKKYYEKNKKKILIRQVQQRKDNPETVRRYREKNKDRLREIRKNYYEKHREKYKEYSRLWYKNNKERWKEYSASNKANARLRRYNSGLRTKLLELLGGKCVRCGFSDPRALQIDHVNGGGSRDNRKIKGNKYKSMLEKICSGYGGYQLLCANCNWIKRVENNETANASYLRELVERL